MACTFCGENRFRSAAQQTCHIAMNHGTHSCGCGYKFTSEEELKSHETTMKKNMKENPCSSCCRSFETNGALTDHKRAKLHDYTKPPNQCDCGKRCKSADGLAQHIRAKQENLNITDAKYKSKGEYYDHFYKTNVMVSKEDRKESVGKCRDTLNKIMDHVRKQEDGKIYSTDIRKAGSHATRTKVKKADEFDVNISLTLPVADVKTKGTVNYIYKDNLNPRDPKSASPENLNVKREMTAVPKGRQHHIPIGYAAVKAKENEKIASKVTHNGDIIPRKVQEDLYSKMNTAIKDLDLKGVHISRNSHGPALTLTKTGSKGKHDINIDVTTTIGDKHIPVGVYGWPRPDTSKVLPQDTIDRIKNVGTHMVPKGGEFWNVSHSKAEKELMKGLDMGNQCRRQCYKMLKADVQTWNSRSTDNYPGISSHLLKHSMFWMNERHKPDNKDYWNQKNIHNCYTDYLYTFKSNLDQCKLPDYFHPMNNMLGKKDKEMCHRLAGCVEERRNELLHMKLLK